jgi:hypothetical protein
VRAVLQALVLLAVFLPARAAEPPATTQPVFPGKTWETVAPDRAGLFGRALDRLREFAGGRGCVVRHGVLAYAWGDIAKAGDVASAAKPVYGFFLFKAIEDHRIGGLDEAVVRYEPRLADLNPDLGFKDRRIAWRHLASQTSCYGVSEPPGAAFDYSDPQMALFWDLLFGRVYGATPATVDDQVLRPMLADAIGCQDRPTFLAFGPKDRPGRRAISPRDFCRFGLLYLHAGRWGDRPLLDPKLVATATGSPLPNSVPRTADRKARMLPGQRTIGGGNNQTDHLGSYSFMWWTNGVDRDDKRHWPDAPPDSYAALGHGGKRAMVVMPALDLVASWNDTRIDGRDMENRAMGLLAAAAATGREAK